MAALSVTADSHHQTTSQSHSPLVQKEVMGALSVTADSHHQTTSQSHSHKRRFSETTISLQLKVVNLSRWWKDALDMLSEAFCKWCDSGGGGGGGGGSVGMEVEVRATTEVVASVRSVATTAAAASSVSGGQV
ncbi:hypothetical protein Pmani_018195 [Petrolisthes manimaculis]|uniref:Uncharacterized protein n=1 Tax=Petrolisthes manimaculis TaxID=1843537 RepID=A0AAE1PKQ6_9EUCA|nr:hypothetical protein Pmani_018195 [Petrolisthes manimaculis]